jgi:hypothetical protein
MTVNLTPMQLAALEGGQPIQVKAEGLDFDCVLIRADLYQRAVESASDDVDTMYPLLADISPEDWEDAADYGISRGAS